MKSKSDTNSCQQITSRPSPPIPRTYGTLSGHHVFRDRQAIAYASMLERDFIVRTEFFVDVVDIVPQPIDIDFNHGRSTQRYTPTFLVQRSRRVREGTETPKPELVEVITEYGWRKHRSQRRPKWRAAIRAANARGWRFRIHDETRIRDRALQNIQYLARFKRTTVRIDASEDILDDLGRTGIRSVATLLKRHFANDSQTYALQQVWALLAQRRIDCSISHQLGIATEVWLPEDN